MTAIKAFRVNEDDKRPYVEVWADDWGNLQDDLTAFENAAVTHDKIVGKLNARYEQDKALIAQLREEAATLIAQRDKARQATTTGGLTIDRLTFERDNAHRAASDWQAQYQATSAQLAQMSDRVASGAGYEPSARERRLTRKAAAANKRADAAEVDLRAARAALRAVQEAAEARGKPSNHSSGLAVDLQAPAVGKDARITVNPQMFGARDPRFRVNTWANGDPLSRADIATRDLAAQVADLWRTLHEVTAAAGYDTAVTVSTNAGRWGVKL